MEATSVMKVVSYKICCIEAFKLGRGYVLCIIYPRVGSWGKSGHRYRVHVEIRHPDCLSTSLIIKYIKASNIFLSSACRDSIPLCNGVLVIDIWKDIHGQVDKDLDCHQKTVR
jgi:hypothetical protein